MGGVYASDIGTGGPPASAGTPTATPAPDKPQTQICQQKAATQNPSLADHLQVFLGFRLPYAIGATVEEGVDIPLMDDGQHFYLSYHLKRVYNSK